MTQIEILDVRSVFNEGRSDEVAAIDGVSARIGARAVTVLTGPSGSGKTTLLALIGCMARPTSGRIVVGDREVTGLPERFLTDVRRRTFGFVFQQFHLLRGISTLENVMLPGYPIGEPRAALLRRALSLLDRFGLAARADAPAERLSGGEAQRAAIARALVNDPAVIIADEPTAHLDTQRSLDFMEIVADLRASGKTMIIATHDPAVFESRVVDRVLQMRDGKLVEARP